MNYEETWSSFLIGTKKFSFPGPHGIGWFHFIKNIGENIIFVSSVKILKDPRYERGALVIPVGMMLEHRGHISSLCFWTARGECDLQITHRRHV